MPVTQALRPAMARRNGSTLRATLLETVPEPVDAVLADPAFQVGGLGIVDGQGPPVALLYSLDEVVGFRVQAPGIDAEDVDFRHRPPDEIGEDDGFRP